MPKTINKLTTPFDFFTNLSESGINIYLDTNTFELSKQQIGKTFALHQDFRLFCINVFVVKNIGIFLKQLDVNQIVFVIITKN